MTGLASALRLEAVERLVARLSLNRRQAVALAALTVSAGVLSAIGIAATVSALEPNRTVAFWTPDSQLTSTFTATRVVTVLALIGVATLLVGKNRPGRAGVALFAVALAIAVGGLNLDTVFAPPTNWAHQWQTNYAPSGNLTEGLQLAANLREGHGLVLDSGKVDTYRMPGYALLVAAAGGLSRASPRDYQDVASATIWMQFLLTAAAIGLFAYVAASRLRRIVLLPILLVLVALPTNVQFSQSDSMIFAASLLVTSALLPFLDRARGDGAGWRDVLLLHLSFAFYFLLRTDITLAWAVISIVVHGRRWRHLLVWPAVFVAIAAGYGAYSKANGQEFTFGTNNTGHVAFVGLWELPQDRFAWEPKDASYDRWISAHGYTYMGPGANAFAEKEILRFYLTYPGYIATMAVNKAINYFDSTAVDLYSTPFTTIHKFRQKLVAGGAWLLACTILLALVAGYRRYQTVLLSWAALLTLPLFFFVQDENRFTLFMVGSLAIGAIPLLLDGGFFRRLHERPWLVGPLVPLLVTIWVYHGWIGMKLLEWEAFRYWAPLLDPKNSTLAVFKH